jgi:hypothetical protein
VVDGLVPELDFAFESFSSGGRFKFKLGPGVPGFELDVTGRGFVFFLFVVVIKDRESTTRGWR